MSGERARNRGRVVPAVVVGVAVLGHLIVLVPFTVASGLVAPLGGIVTLYVVWGIFAGVLFYLARRRPLLTPLVPLANVAVLVGVLTFGEQVLGWTP